MASQRDPRTLTNLSEILSCLSAFQTEEAELSSTLRGLLNDREPVISALQRLHLLEPQFEHLLLDARGLKKRVSSTAKTADRIGQKVRSLDEEMGRIREAGERVGQVMDLKVCDYFSAYYSKRIFRHR